RPTAFSNCNSDLTSRVTSTITRPISRVPTISVRVQCLSVCLTAAADRMNGANQGNPGMMPYSQGQHPHPPPPPGMPYHHANGPQSMGYHSVPGQQPYMYGQYGHAASYQQYYPMNYPNYQHPHPY